AVVRRRHGRVHARESARLLSADDHRFREPLSPDVRSAVDDAGKIRLHRVRARVHRLWAAGRDLSKLSVWWLRLGIQIERIQPGHPQQNGRHERMHLTLKREATKPAAANVLQQQARFDAFVERYNRERPHQALGMKVPADLYTRSARVYRGLQELTY